MDFAIWRNTEIVMKIDALNSVVALILAALLSYGCYAFCGSEDMRLLITIASFIELSVVGIGTFAVSFADQRRGTMFRILSGIFLGVLVAANGLAMLFGFSIPLYVILFGLILVLYLLLGGFVARTELA